MQEQLREPTCSNNTELELIVLVVAFSNKSLGNLDVYYLDRIHDLFPSLNKYKFGRCKFRTYGFYGISYNLDMLFWGQSIRNRNEKPHASFPLQLASAPLDSLDELLYDCRGIPVDHFFSLTPLLTHSLDSGAVNSLVILGNFSLTYRDGLYLIPDPIHWRISLRDYHPATLSAFFDSSSECLTISVNSFPSFYLCPSGSHPLIIMPHQQGLSVYPPKGLW
ncbi:hypothetical protein EPI10_028169 [Gossypium australe]|uniref:Uncharacterized protein n=1 Tax=Gossypium australe TaxID=47621 RepID=A0A5B6UU08_9ROSI|nr:hypothetical protein EPI10_028169 [Gossypium australe]